MDAPPEMKCRYHDRAAHPKPRQFSTHVDVLSLIGVSRWTRSDRIAPPAGPGQTATRGVASTSLICGRMQCFAAARPWTLQLELLCSRQARADYSAMGEASHR